MILCGVSDWVLEGRSACVMPSMQHPSFTLSEMSCREVTMQLLGVIR